MREFFYKRSDILVALLIIVIAAVVIYYRVTAIMTYPQVVANGGAGQNAPIVQTEPNTEDATIAEDGADIVDAGEGTDAQAPEGADIAAQGEEAPASVEVQPGQDVEFTIDSSDSSVSVTDKLFEAGLITDKQAFLAEVAAAEAETSLGTGTYTIPAGLTAAEIISIITVS